MGQNGRKGGSGALHNFFERHEHMAPISKVDLSKLAVAGILGGSLALGATGCSKSEDGGGGKSATEATDSAAKYMDIHDCKGKNTCKGLGGCHMSQADLEKFAKAAGVPMDKAGAAHECAGHNECKGLGGCSVDADKLAKLKAQMAK